MTADILNGLGNVLVSRGEDRDAEGFLREALSIRRRLCGEEHPYVAESLTSLGTLLSERLRTEGYSDHLYEEAEAMLRTATAMDRKLLFMRDPTARLGENALAVLYMAHDDLVAAEKVLREGIEIRQQQLGVDHLAVAESIENLGFLSSLRGDYESAVTFHKEALRIRRLRSGDKMQVATNLTTLGIALRDGGSYVEAEPIFRDAIAVYTKLGSARVAGPMHNLGVVLMNLGEYEEAERLIREAYGMIETEVGDSAERSFSRLQEWNQYWRLANVRCEYGAILTKLARYAQAEEHLLVAYQLAIDNVNDDELTLKVVGSVVELYEAWGKPEKAAEYRALLEEAEQQEIQPQ